MKYKEYFWVILCEDKSQYHFVQGWLNENNAKKIKIYGKLQKPGSAKSYVIENYRNAADSVRSQSKYKKVVLVVFIDADEDSVSEIIKKLDYNNNDLAFLVIPKRNIETWIRFIKNPNHPLALDEEKSCRNSYHYTTRFGKEGRNFSKWKFEDILKGPQSLRRCARLIEKKKRVLDTIHN